MGETPSTPSAAAPDSPSAPAPTSTPAPGPCDYNPQRLHLWFEQFRDMALLSLTLAGGAITLLGTLFATAPKRGSALLSIVFFGAAAIGALAAQIGVVDLSDRGEAPTPHLRMLRVVVLLLLGAGVGAFGMFAVRQLS